MRILRIRDVVQLTGISRASIWRLERAGQFPNRISLLGGRVGWYAQEIQKWIRSRRTSQTQRGENTMSALLTTKEAAQLLDFSEADIKDTLLNDTTFPQPLTRNGRRYFDETALVEWANDNDIAIYNEEEYDETDEEYDNVEDG